jgi:DNA-binding SARP family transcriptional activator
MMTLLRCHLDAGKGEQGVGVARRVLSLDPVRETAHRALMRFYADMGDRALALKQYQSCCDILHSELGVQPETKTQRLYEQYAANTELTSTKTCFSKESAAQRRRCRTNHRSPFCPSST